MNTQPCLEPEPQDALSRRLTRALEMPARFSIPAGFATRTAAAAAQLPAPAAATPRAAWTTLAFRAAFVMLALAMVVFAAWARTAPNSQQFLLLGTEIGLALEFVALTTWLSLRPPSAFR
jgi:hypothetical protein